MPLDELPPLDGVPERARRTLRWFDTEVGGRWLWYVIVALVLLAVAVVVGRGGSRPPDPQVVNQPASTGVTLRSGSARSLPGFGEAALTVVSADGPHVLCVAVADTDAQHQQGLMGRADLGGYDAMAFRFASDSTVRFYMRATPLPLSIAWYDGGGGFVSSTDMDPCPDRDGCPTYAAAGPYRLALEVPKGALAAAGLVAGSTVSLGGGCS